MSCLKVFFGSEVFFFGRGLSPALAGTKQLTYPVTSHGRDNKILVWKLGSVQDETGMDIALPVEENAGHRRSPWLLSSLDVNALNFCGFAMCVEQRARVVDEQEEREETLLVAVPSVLNSDSVCYRFVDVGEDPVRLIGYRLIL